MLKMNTKFVGHHVSSGGFIFSINNETKELYVLLIKNNKNEWWIPKGHIEEGESQLETAFREIEEEVGIKKDQLKYIDLSDIYRFSFNDKEGTQNTKEIYMNVFDNIDMCDIKAEENETTDILDVKWFSYEEALNKIIPFSKNELIKAKDIYTNYKLI